MKQKQKTKEGFICVICAQKTPMHKLKGSLNYPICQQCYQKNTTK